MVLLLFVINSGPTVDNIVKAFQFGMFCWKDVEQSPSVAWNPATTTGFCCWLRLEADNILKADFVTTLNEAPVFTVTVYPTWWRLCAFV